MSVLCFFSKHGVYHVHVSCGYTKYRKAIYWSNFARSEADVFIAPFTGDRRWIFQYSFGIRKKLEKLE